MTTLYERIAQYFRCKHGLFSHVVSLGNPAWKYTIFGTLRAINDVTVGKPITKYHIWNSETRDQICGYLALTQRGTSAVKPGFQASS